MSKTKKIDRQKNKNHLFVGLVITIFAIIGCVFVFQSMAMEVQEDSPIRFSMGSKSVETANGNVWEAGGYNANGTPFVASNQISGTDDQLLYQTQRQGITSFKVGQLPKGRYKLTLLFADTEATAKGQRVFSIFAEGKEEKAGLDIVRKAGGGNKAYNYDFSLDVADGTLDVEFKPSVGVPILSAVELVPRKLDEGSASNIPEPSGPIPPTAPPTPTQPTPSEPAIPNSVPTAFGRQVNVFDSQQLSAAIATAHPGDVITLADGRYTGKKAAGKYTGSFVPLVSGTATRPIVIRGSRNAVIDGDGQGGHYGLYLVGANYWRIEGITVTDATKGIVLDGSNHVVMDDILVTSTGQEGVHFRSNSSDGTIMNSEISYTGARNATYGEGVYIGSANSNWGTYTGGQPDRSDRIQVLNNDIQFTGAENIDIKEGTTGGIIKGNKFDGREMRGSWADSWIDVKGNNYTIVDNTGNNALLDGFQIHVAIKGWGNGNYFAGNIANVNGPGYGLTIQSGTTGNVWKCDNLVRSAAKGAVAENGKPVTCKP